MAESEDGQEKTEDPSSRRLQQARDKGQIARSKELTSFVLVIGTTVLMLVMGSRFLQSMSGMADRLFSFSPELIENPYLMTELVFQQIQSVVSQIAPFFVGIFILTIISSVLLGGMHFSLTILQPQLNRVGFISGIKRMFSVKSLMEMFKALAKFILVAGVALIVLYYKVPELIGVGKDTPSQAMQDSIIIIFETFLWVASSIIIVVLIDVPFQIWQHTSQLKMTKQEKKDEFKQTEGKPEVKSKVRQVQREIAQRRMMDKVPDADIVITNPEHYAVALRYNSSTDQAPILLAKGQDLMALKIRQIADHHKISVLQAPPLARAVYYSTQLDQPIPEGLYLAVAQALAYVYQLNEYQKGRRTKPAVQPDFPIPETYRRE